MVLGKSGSGKSSSLRNFGESEIGVLNVAAKPLPFRKHLLTVNRPSYDQVKTAIMSGQFLSYAVDDSTYLMQFDAFKYAKVKGYDKFVDMAVDFRNMLDCVMYAPQDTIVYLLHHPQFSDDGSSKPQTVGKMLDNQLCIEGLFPIIIETARKDGEYVFVTETDGTGLAKAPVDFETGERMLPAVMPNDLKRVDRAIREYWHLAPNDGPNAQ